MEKTVSEVTCANLLKTLTEKTLLMTKDLERLNLMRTKAMRLMALHHLRRDVIKKHQKQLAKIDEDIKGIKNEISSDMQRKQPLTSLSPLLQFTMTCVVCLECKSLKQFRFYDSCCHYICMECFIENCRLNMHGERCPMCRQTPNHLVSFERRGNVLLPQVLALREPQQDIEQLDSPASPLAIDRGGEEDALQINPSLLEIEDDSSTDYDEVNAHLWETLDTE
jgi:hypothetical protein